MEWEMFFDESYYGLWTVRWTKDKNFNSLRSFSFSKKEDAQAFLDLLNKAIYKIINE